MSKVFVVTNPHRLDRSTNELRPHLDFTDAERFGELEFLLSPSANPFSPALGSIVMELHDKLSDWQPGDYLLLVGNPCLIGMAMAIAADYADGVVDVLQWHGGERCYKAIHVDMNTPEE